MNMKNKDLNVLKEALVEMSNNSEYKGIEFAYFVIKNKKVIENQINIFNELLKDEKIEAYEKERAEILQKYSTDENGEVKTKKISEDRVEYIIQDNFKEAYLTAMNELRETYLEDLKNYEKKFIEYQELMNKDVDSDLVLQRVDKSKLPNNLSIKHLDAIFDLVEM